MPAKQPLIDNIPQELKILNQWVMYRIEDVPGQTKPTKKPYQINGKLASSTNPKTWCTFEEAIIAYKKGNYSGVGFVFSKEDPYTGIDLDGCYDPKTTSIKPWADNWIKRIDSYTEWSPSKTGFHIISKGEIPSGKKVGDYEIYNTGRYFTFTGDLLSTKLNNIEKRQTIINEFYNYLSTKSKSQQSSEAIPDGHELTANEIKEIISKAKAAKNGDKFSKLFKGDYGEYPSQSEADLALCNILAYWTNNNPVAMNQIFSESDLYRAKWQREDYRNNTIRTAISVNYSQAQKDFSIVSKSTTTDKIPIIHIADVKSQKVEFQIDKIWPINSVGIMSGQPGVLKTWFAWETAVSIASGTKLLNTYQCQKGKVLVFNAEDSLEMCTKARVAAFASQKGLSLKELDFYHLDIPSLLINNEETQIKMENTIKEFRPDFIIFDPLRNVHSLDEDNATAMMPMLHFLREINRKYNCSILLVCHDNKWIKKSGNRAAQIRGSSAIIGWRDNILFLDKDSKCDDVINVSLYNKICQSIDPFSMRLITENDANNTPLKAHFELTSPLQVTYEKESETVSEIKKIIQESGPISRNNIINIIKKKRGTILDLINSLINTKDIISTSKGLIINSLIDLE